MHKGTPIGPVKGPQLLGNENGIVASRKGFSLRPGYQFNGQVIQKFSDTKVLLISGNNKFVAHSTLPLKKGIRYSFQVRSVTPNIELKVLDKGISNRISPVDIWASSRAVREKLTESVRELVLAQRISGMPAAAKEALQKLNNLLPLTIFGGSEKKDALWLPRNLLAGGIFWENKIHGHLRIQKNVTASDLIGKDLKGLLLSLKKIIENEEEKSPELRGVIRRIEEALGLVEKEQMQSLSSMKEGWGWFWVIPALQEDGFRKAEVFGKKSEDGSGYRICMRLELTNLGKMDVQVSLSETVINIKIFVQEEATSQLIFENFSLLRLGLEKMGLVVGQLSCEVQVEGENILSFLKDGDDSHAINVFI